MKEQHDVRLRVSAMNSHHTMYIYI